MGVGAEAQLKLLVALQAGLVGADQTGFHLVLGLPHGERGGVRLFRMQVMAGETRKLAALEAR